MSTLSNIILEVIAGFDVERSAYPMHSSDMQAKVECELSEPDSLCSTFLIVNTAYMKVAADKYLPYRLAASSANAIALARKHSKFPSRLHRQPGGEFNYQYHINKLQMMANSFQRKRAAGLLP